MRSIVIVACLVIVFSHFIPHPSFSQSKKKIAGHTSEEPFTIDISPARYLRSASLSFGDAESGLVNDYKVFGIVNDAITRVWKTRKTVSVYINNGLTFNSRASTSSQLEKSEFDISITIQFKKRIGKLLYVFDAKCTEKNESYQSAQFDLIKEDRFYSEMKRLAVKFAEGCPG